MPIKKYLFKPDTICNESNQNSGLIEDPGVVMTKNQ